MNSQPFTAVPRWYTCKRQLWKSKVNFQRIFYRFYLGILEKYLCTKKDYMRGFQLGFTYYDKDCDQGAACVFSIPFHDVFFRNEIYFAENK